MGPIHGTIINGYTHKYGYRNFEMKNTSHNILPIDFLIQGEGYHNNHHKFATSANFGYKRFEIDPTYYVIKALDFLHIIKLKETSNVHSVSLF
jgi:stearoyl-CoA desaturase (delta-9 desaturase)